MKIFLIFILTTIFLNNNFAQDIDTSILNGLSGLEKMETLCSLSLKLYNKKPEQSFRYSSKALEMAEEVQNYRIKSKAVSNKALYYRMKGDFKKAEKLHKEALKIAINLNNLHLIADEYNRLGILSKKRGELKVSVKYYQKAMDIALKLDDKKIQSKLNNNMAIIYNHWGRYTKALDLQFQNLRMNEAGKSYVKKATTYNNIGNIYMNKEDYKSAIYYHQKAIKLKIKASDLYGIATSNINLSRIYIKQGKYDTAYFYLNKSEKFVRKNKFKQGIVIILKFQGEIEQRKGNSGIAAGKYHLALELNKESQSKSEEVELLMGMALAQNSLGNTHKAITLLKTSLVIANNLKTPKVKQEILKHTSKIYEQTSNHKEALKYYKEYTSLKDSIFKIKDTDRMAEIRSKYELDKKEQENQRLRENQRIKNYIFIGISILIIFYFFNLYNRYYINKRNQKQLEEKVKQRTTELIEKIKEKEIAEEEILKFKTISDNSKNGVAILDTNFNINYINNFFSEIHGYKENELDNKNFLKLYPKGEAKKIKNIITNWEGCQGITPLEIWHKNKNDELFPMLINVIDIKNKNNESLYYAVSAVNIQEIKQVENDLRQSKQQLKAFIQAMPDMAFVITQNGEYERVLTSKKNEIIYGKRIEGLSFNELFPKSTALLFQKTINKTIESKKMQKLEYSLMENDEEHWYEGRTSYMNINNRDLVIWIAREISDRKKAEKNLQRINDNLEQLVDKRTQKLQIANENLLLLKEKAETATKTKSDFLANMSHEIRTPMNAVLGFTELLITQITDPKHKAYLDAIKTGGKSLLVLINDILDLSKIEAGKMEVEYRSTKLENVLSEMQNIFSLKTDEKGLDLIFDIQQNLPENIIFDEIRIRQILFNLIGNAIKFTERGFIKISTFFEKTNNNSIDLKIEIEDTGIGIAPEAQDQIFKAFKQQEGQSNRKYGGTGLGLTITKGLVEMMKGEILLSSKINKGSHFSLIFKDVKINNDNKKSKPQISDYYIDIKFEKARILLVDDVKYNRELIQEYLTITNLEVETAENGLVAFEKAKRKKPDLILMDIRMPIMDGYESSKKIKEIYPKIPIIAITASAMKEEQERLLRNHFETFLMKPINRKDLINELSKYLEIKEKTINNINKRDNKDIEEIKNNMIDEKQLSKILEYLEKFLFQKWEKAKKTNRMKDINTFAKEIKSFAEKEKLKSFIDFGKNLLFYTNNFDIENLTKELKKYPKLISELKKLK